MEVFQIPLSQWTKDFNALNSDKSLTMRNFLLEHRFNRVCSLSCFLWRFLIEAKSKDLCIRGNFASFTMTKPFTHRHKLNNSRSFVGQWAFTLIEFQWVLAALHLLRFDRFMVSRSMRVETLWTNNYSLNYSNRFYLILNITKHLKLLNIHLTNQAKPFTKLQ